MVKFNIFTTRKRVIQSPQNTYRWELRSSANAIFSAGSKFH